jgi:hypothetical protein
MFSAPALIFNFFYISIGFYILTAKSVHKSNLIYYIFCISLIIFSFNFFYFGYAILPEIIELRIATEKKIRWLILYSDYMSMFWGFMMGVLYLRFLFQKDYMVKNVSKDL